MAQLDSLGRAEEYEKAIAARLGVDTSDICGGSMTMREEPGRASVTWRCYRDVEPGFMNLVVQDVAQMEKAMDEYAANTTHAGTWITDDEEPDRG